jgi:hypothetical protein
MTPETILAACAVLVGIIAIIVILVPAMVWAARTLWTEMRKDTKVRVYRPRSRKPKTPTEVNIYGADDVYLAEVGKSKRPGDKCE